MLNKELFVEDPTLRDIPNLGVAKLGNPDTPQEWETLQFELSHFVCDGAYAHGLDSILGSYLTSLSAAQQPAAWVSGFYGSGKSHFLRVLEHLWLNTALPDGSSARGLVNSPEDVSLHLRELDNAGKRNGGVWAAAGTMGAGASGSAKLAFLRILFLAAKLPPNYPAARFVIWLRQQELEDRVRQHVDAAGKSFDTELRNMYVSPFLATAIMESVPGIADTTQAMRMLLKEQYPQVEDVTNDELLAVMDDVMQLVSAKPDARPCTLVILDELQQYIGTDSVRTLAVQDIVEAVQSQFGSLVTFVAAGQSAMGSHPQLQKLQGRFTTRVEFADTDVDSVVRQVILRKKPDAVPTLKTELDRVAGEISRHLQGTKIAPVADDEKDMVADYPLLPTRRRFWEHVLRAIDTGGTASQLRTQLRIVQEAAKFVAEDKVGVVVPADFIYEQQSTGMLYAGVLTRDAHETIEGLRDGSPDGGIAHRIASTVFLLNQLKQANPNLGMRVAADTISDLLVSDLSAGSGDLRRTVEATLKKLVDQGALTSADGEYGLQTPESAEWVKEFRTRITAIKGEAPRLAAMRSAELQKALQRHLGSLMVTQGEYKVSRRGRLHLGQDAPKLDDDVLPVWVRDEWDISLKAAEQEAIRRGPDDPIVHLLLPKEEAQAVSDELVKLAAASDTLDARAMPTTDEGVRARAGIDTIRQGAQARVEEALRNAVNSSRVFLSGGREFTDSSPKTAAEAALRAAAERLYPKFSVADDPAWGVVVRKVSEKGAEALQSVGWDGDPDKQPVCAAVLDFVGAGKRGGDVRQYFGAVPFGWPQDAIDGALMVMANATVDILRVEQNGAPIKAVQVNQASLGKVDFKRQSVVVSPTTRIGLRGLFQDAGISCKSNDETVGLGQYLQHLKELAQRAGGAAPLPAVPDVGLVAGVQALSGNEQLNEAWSHSDALSALRIDWQRRATEINARMSRWERLERLIRMAKSVPTVAEAGDQMQSIVEQRSLLDDPDATTELLQRVTSAIRDEIRTQFAFFTEARKKGVDELTDVQEFKAVPKERWRAVVEKCGLGPLPELQLGSDEEILRELELHPLGMWPDLIAGMRQRVEDARELLAKELEPETVRFVPSPRTLKSVGDVDAYLADMKTEIMKHIEAGKPVIVSR